jgi:hypothetical protein
MGSTAEIGAITTSDICRFLASRPQVKSKTISFTTAEVREMLKASVKTTGSFLLMRGTKCNAAL